MELVQELVMTAVIAVLFSFLVAKLVSLAAVGDSGSVSELKSGKKNVEERGGIVMEELQFGERLTVQGFESEKKVQFIEETAKKVDEFGEEGESARVVEILETEHCGERFLEKLPEKCLGDESEIVELREKPLEETVKEAEGFVDEVIKEADIDDIVEEKFKGSEVKEIGVELATDKDIVEQSEKIRVVQSESEGGDEEKEEGLDGDEDDWEGIERTELEKVFAAAAKFVGSGEKGDLASAGSDAQMELYGLHKVATEGPCRESQPMALMVSARAKWNAWQRLGNMNPEVAMEQYIALLSDRVPRWMEDNSAVDGKPESQGAGSPGAVAPDLSPFPNNQIKYTDESILELKYGAEGGDLTGGSSLVGMAKE